MLSNKQIIIKKPNKLSAFFICLIIATLLWFLHALNTVYIKDLAVPVVFRNTPADKLPLSDLPSALSIKIKASGLKLLLMSVNDFKQPLELDFNQLKSDAGQTRYVVSSDIKNLKSFLKFQVDVKSVFPDTLVFTSKNASQKLVPVKPLLNLDFKQGYTLGKVSVSPDKIIVTGNTAELKTIDTVFTAPVFESGIDEQISRMVQLQKPSSGIIFEKNKVQISVSAERLIERSVSLTLEPDKEIAGHQLVFFPSKVQVKLTAPASEQQVLDSANIKGVVKTNAITNKKMPVQLIGIPQGWHVIKQSPKEVEFLMIKK